VSGERLQVIVARSLGHAEFHVAEGANLGGSGIEVWLEVPRYLDEAGNICLDVFAFRPVSALDLERFRVGRVVSLTG